MTIQNKEQLINNAKSDTIKKLRRDILEALEAATNAVDPKNLMKNNVILTDKKLEIVNDLSLNLEKFNNIYVLGAGKASFMMANGLEEILGERIKDGFINVYEIPEGVPLRRVKVICAGHPYPDKAGMTGAKYILEIAEKAEKNDLVFVLISGGGSAMMPMPAGKIKLEDKIEINKLLVKSAATIEEINCVRKHLSAIKGGWLAKTLYPATVVCLYLSDVIGDDLSTIASGPCVPDKTTFGQAMKILKKYEADPAADCGASGQLWIRDESAPPTLLGCASSSKRASRDSRKRNKLWEQAPKNIREHLEKGAKNKKMETPKVKDEAFRRGKFYHYVVGSNKVALRAAKKELSLRGYECEILTDKLRGEVANVAKNMLERVAKVSDKGMPQILLAGGETTLTLKGTGAGGRNQELAMLASKNIPIGAALVSYNTDGVDGKSPEEIAGGICDEWTFARATEKGIGTEQLLANNDSYEYLRQVGETIKTGKTGTNVGDIVMIGVV